MIDNYKDGVNAVILTLRENLDKVNSCPDFSSLIFRREDKDEDIVRKETFVQEVAI